MIFLRWLSFIGFAIYVCKADRFNLKPNSNNRMKKESVETLIVGGGLAGLAAASTLAKAGREVLLVEKDESLGGRIQTDSYQGFLLDRGFQVLLSSYPAAREMLDLSELELHPFASGAVLALPEQLLYFGDPLREPGCLWQTLRAPVASISDKLRVGISSLAARAKTLEFQEEQAESTLEYLRSSGYSEKIIENFFRPFFSGVFLESELETPANFFRYLFQAFAKGQACLPSQGMKTIPMQLASTVPSDSIRLGVEAESVHGTTTLLSDGTSVTCRNLVLACPEEVSDRLLERRNSAGAWRSTTCCYFTGAGAEFLKNRLLLNATGKGMVNSVCVPSAISPSYAPKETPLISVSTLGAPPGDERTFLNEIRTELEGWFGSHVHQWQFLRRYSITHALPSRWGIKTKSEGPVFFCGDYTHQPSIQGALRSGKAVAEQLVASGTLSK